VLTARVESWRDAGGFEEVAGRQLYVQRRDGEGPLLLLLHGFPSSSYDWRELLALRPANAALAFDCLGFGLSDKPREHTYTLAWQADAAEDLVRRRGNSPAVFVVAHDMGTSVATELIARDLRGELGMDVRGALLFNGSMLLHLSRPTLGQRLLRSRLGPLFSRLTTERGFRAQFSRVFSAEHPLGAEEAADQWSLLAHNGGQRIGHLLVNYMAERERFTERWHGAIRDWPGPLTLTWGLRDPVARVEVLDGLRELRSGVEVLELPELAHYPQIEAPRQVAAALDRALATAGYSAR
jgi:pimeloyl-ACP methyl ester carboxylesterase